MSNISNISDQKFGRLTALYVDTDSNKKKRCWVCKCECGKITSVVTNNLKSGITRSCGCLAKENTSKMAKNRLNNKLTDKERDNLVLLWKSGLSTGEISKIVNITHSSVASALKTRNINTTDGGIRVKKNEFLLLENAFNNNNEETDYWGGFLAADGYMRKSNIDIILELKGSDVDHLFKLQKFIGSKHKITNSSKFTKNGNFCELRKFSFRSKHIAKILQDRYNIINKKSLTYSVPEEMKFNHNFWRGMIDGDGSLYIQRKTLILYMCGTKNVCESFLEFCKTFGNTTASVRRHGKIYDVSIAKKELVKNVLNKIYKNNIISLDRKYKIYKDYYEL